MDPTTLNTANLLAALESAADAYYNGGELQMEDETYDAYREELARRDPDHPFLQRVGAPVVAENAVQLPVAMPSLRKIKPAKGDVGRFQTRTSDCRSYVLSEKLDGISVLWDTFNQKLYLRGDGLVGVDISHLAPHITGLRPSPAGAAAAKVIPMLLRGELVVANKTLAVETLPRSWVNGLVHQKSPPPADLAKLRFVAYEILNPTGLTRSQQMERLASAGFEIPWWTVVSRISDELLAEILQGRRAPDVCPYSIDGIVVGENRVPLRQSEKKDDCSLPKDMVAFKMVMADQCGESVIEAVHWKASRQGYLIPRIQIQPVPIQGSTITYFTGHNARFIIVNQLCVGARVLVRKSGDVIPCLDRVLSLPANSAPALPPASTWRWDGDPSTASHIVLKTPADTSEVQLQHFAKTLELPHLGEGNIRKWVAAGHKTAGQLLRATQTELQEAIGTAIGGKIWTALQAVLAKPPEEKVWMIASNLLPRGVADSKLSALFAVEANPQMWPAVFSCSVPAGWSSASFQEVLACLPCYEAWRKSEVAMVPYPLVAPRASAAPPSDTKVCFTGFRNKEVEKRAISAGMEIVGTVSKKTTYLVIPDGDKEDLTSTKVQKAKELATVRILALSDFVKLL